MHILDLWLFGLLTFLFKLTMQKFEVDKCWNNSLHVLCVAGLLLYSSVKICETVMLVYTL